jgi:hypothetical protein
MEDVSSGDNSKDTSLSFCKRAGDKSDFKDLEELNSWLEEQCIAIGKKRKHPEEKERTIWELFQEEQQILIPVRSIFDGYAERECRGG